MTLHRQSAMGISARADTKTEQRKHFTCVYHLWEASAWMDRSTPYLLPGSICLLTPMETTVVVKISLEIFSRVVATMKDCPNSAKLKELKQILSSCLLCFLSCCLPSMQSIYSVNLTAEGYHESAGNWEEKKNSGEKKTKPYTLQLWLLFLTVVKWPWFVFSFAHFFWVFLGQTKELKLFLRFGIQLPFPCYVSKETLLTSFKGST